YHNQHDKIRIESLDGTRSTMNDGDLRACDRGHVSKFHRDVTATDKDDAWRQRIQFEKLIADGEEILSRNAQRGRFRADSDDEVPGLENLAGYFKRIRACEAGRTVESCNAGLEETVFFLLRE